tara:strand:- start:24 stop:446 length:423 start_codon:yes stop_codon:yes gene_type:complete
MAQIIGDKLFVFHKLAIDGNSVLSHDAGTQVDYFAIPAKSLASISCVDDVAVLYFNNGNEVSDQYAGTATETMEYCNVRLTVTSENIPAFIKELWIMMNSVSASPVIEFDAVNSVFASDKVTGVTSIIRHVTTHTIASDS